MPQLLVLTASPRAAPSRGRAAAARFVEALGGCLPALTIVERDLGHEPPPFPDAAFVAASLTPPDERSPEQREALVFADALIAELDAADLVLIATPMHNFTVPASLKAWIDHVVRPHASFRSTPAGKVGLLRDRPVLVLIACGGPVGEGPGMQSDFLSPYLSYAFGTIGLRDIEILRLDRLARGDEAMAKAHQELEASVARQAERLGEKAIPAEARVRGADCPYFRGTRSGWCSCHRPRRLNSAPADTYSMSSLGHVSTAVRSATSALLRSLFRSCNSPMKN